VGSADVRDESNSDSAEAVEKEIAEVVDRSSLIVSETLVEAAISIPTLELRAEAGESEVTMTGDPVSIAEMMVCEVWPWLREAISVIDMLSSTLLAVASNDSDNVTVEDSSSGSRTDATLLGEGGVSMTELVSAPESDEVSATDRVFELVVSSGRSVGCARVLVGVAKSESIITELVPVTSSTTLELKTSSDADDVIGACSETMLEGMSVAEGRIETSVAISGIVSDNIEVSVWASTIEVTDGAVVISAKLIEETDSVVWVRTSVGVTGSDSMGTMLVLAFSRSITELLMSGKSGTFVSEERNWDTTLERTSVAEERVGASVTIWETPVCVPDADVMDGKRSDVSAKVLVGRTSDVSARVLVGEMSDSIAELSITAELKEEVSWVAELESRSPSPVSRGSDDTVADVIGSRMLLDGKSVITGTNSVTESEDKPDAEGIARTLVVKSEIVSDETEVSDARSKLNVMDGSSVVCKVLEVKDSGSMIELSITAEIKDEASWITETFSTEPVVDISGASVTEERTSSLVIDGKSLVRIDTDVASRVGSALIIKGEASKLIVVDGSPVVSSSTLGVAASDSLVKFSTTVGTIDGVSWMTELVADSSSAVVTEERVSSPVIDGKLFVGSNVGMVSSVGSALVFKGVERSGGSSELDIIDGSTVVSSRALEVTSSGSLLELSTTVGISDGMSWTIELVIGTSGTVVTGGTTSSLVIDGKPLVGAGMDVVSSVGSAFATEGVRISVKSPKTDVTDGPSPWTALLGVGSTLIAELSTTNVMIDDMSGATELASKMLVSETTVTGVIALETSTLTPDGISVIEGNIEVVSRVASMSVVDGTEASDWISVLAVISGISVGCSRGSAVTEDSLSSTELLTGSGAESVGIAGVKNSVWVADAEISGSKSEVKEVMNVVGPPRMSGVDVSMLVRSSEAVAVVRIGMFLEVAKLL
jgi:hypothetical protein